MRLSNSFFITRREVPKDEVNISSKLLVKSGMIMKLENGIYSLVELTNAEIASLSKELGIN